MGWRFVMTQHLFVLMTKRLFVLSPCGASPACKPLSPSPCPSLARARAPSPAPSLGRQHRSCPSPFLFLSPSPSLGRQHRSFPSLFLFLAPSLHRAACPSRVCAPQPLLSSRPFHPQPYPPWVVAQTEPLHRPPSPRPSLFRAPSPSWRHGQHAGARDRSDAPPRASHKHRSDAPPAAPAGLSSCRVIMSAYACVCIYDRMSLCISLK